MAFMQNGHPITSLEPAHLAGKTVAHSYTWSDTKRAQLAAKATFGAVIVSPLTAAQAAEIFGVPTTAVTAELKKEAGRRAPPYQRQRPHGYAVRAGVGGAYVGAALGIPYQEFRRDLS
jgi:hypothetical protein